MKYLADTHILIWALSDDPKLTLEGREILLNSENTIYFSIVNVWEVGIKYSLHKECFNFSAEAFYSLCITSGYEMLPFSVNHIFTMETLKRPKNAPRHRDPFDRLLLAQAKTENICFLSHDSLLKDYHEPYLKNI
ncbi:MAG: type II toxin-antitoxin system VapC family toxin [Eubacterium sp.]|nr:type II toxin-antitoxin system VapC family toxin [Eubacterium sp.]